jgi:hypothetical protein
MAHTVSADTPTENAGQAEEPDLPTMQPDRQADTHRAVGPPRVGESAQRKRRKRRRSPGHPSEGQPAVAGSAADAGSEKPAETVILAWSVHLGKGRPVRLAIGLAAIAGSAALAYLLMRNPITPVVMTFVLLAALADLFFPTHFRITTQGAYRRNFLSSAGIRWKDVRKCYLGSDGIKVSPLPRRSRLEAFRGIYLLFGDLDRETVIEKVKELRDGVRSIEHGMQSTERGGPHES